MTKQTKTVSIKGYVTHETGFMADDEQPYSFQTWRPTAGRPDLVVVNELSIEIEVPINFDPRPRMIQNLEAEQRKAVADFEAATTARMRKIGELQALEMS